MRLACALLLAHVSARPQQRAKPLALKPVTGRAAAKPIDNTALCVSGGAAGDRLFYRERLGALLRAGRGMS